MRTEGRLWRREEELKAAQYTHAAPNRSIEGDVVNVPLRKILPLILIYTAFHLRQKALELDLDLPVH